VNEHTETEVHLPSPTVWPAVVGAGVALIAFGIAISFYFCGLGLVLFAWGLRGWINELRHGHD
jgi:hypothetical protein